MSNITSCDSGSISISIDAVKQHHQSEILIGNFHSPNSHDSSSLTNNSNASTNNTNSQPPPLKKKRSLPGNPDPSAEVIALSPNTLVAKNRFMCEICNKGFQRDQNLQLHRRGHNLPWKLKQRTTAEVPKRVYVCPEPSCVHHNPARALGDLTGIKKHFSRKHGEKKWKCDKCSKKYAVQSDLKAHSRICGTKEYKCDCGTIFSRRDSFITHRAFCDALAEENFNKVYEGAPPHLLLSKMQQRVNSNMFQGQPNLPVPSLPTTLINNNNNKPQEPIPSLSPISSSNSPSSLQLSSSSHNNSLNNNNNNMMFNDNGPHYLSAGLPPHTSATALLQKAAQMGSTAVSNINNNNIITSMPLPATSSPFGSVPTSNGVMEQQYYVHNINAQHDMFLSHEYNFNNVNGIDGMNGVDMFNAILDQSKALSKIIEQNSNRNSSINVGSSCPMNIGIRSSSKGGDHEGVMTLDLLGIGAGGGGGSTHGYFCNPLN